MYPNSRRPLSAFCCTRAAAGSLSPFKRASAYLQRTARRHTTPCTALATPRPHPPGALTRPCDLLGQLHWCGGHVACCRMLAACHTIMAVHSKTMSQPDTPFRPSVPLTPQHSLPAMPRSPRLLPNTPACTYHGCIWHCAAICKTI